MTRLVGLMLVTTACIPTAPPVDSGSGPTTETGTSPYTDVPVYFDEGSVMVLVEEPSFFNPTRRTRFAGMAVETRDGWLNHAQCIGLQEYCIEQFPTDPDTHVQVTLYTDGMREGLETFDIGKNLFLGPFKVPRNEGIIAGETVYVDSDAGILPESNMNLKFRNGDWGDFDEIVVDRPPTPMVLTSHDPGQLNQFADTGPIGLTWEPGDDGDVYLLAQTPELARLYWLEDDGAYDVDLSDLELEDGDTLQLRLGRWVRVPVNQYGNDIQVFVESEVLLAGNWRSLTGRTEITPADDCTAAAAAPALDMGSYWGRMDGLTGQNNPGTSGCTGVDTVGPDGMFTVEIPKDGSLDVTFNVLNGDGAVYLLSNCLASASCVAASANGGFQQTEALSYTNTSGADQTMTLVVDSVSETGTFFELDVQIFDPEGDYFKDTCAEALGAAPLFPALYAGDLTLYNNVLDPAPTVNCGQAAAGQDGIAPVSLLPGQSLTATVEMPGQDPVLYLMYNCSFTDSCHLIENAAAGPSESLQYTNASTQTEIHYLVIDGVTSSGPYTLDLLIQ